ncbi:hypothetical protein LUZ60_006099 [Juncus effusus]|nr:hypothetical protein LUZ60_006099 [Juncus effusus]
MDDDGGLGIRNWGYYDPHPQIKTNSNLGLQLMSQSADRDSKPFLNPTNSSSFLSHAPIPPHHHHHQIPISFSRPDMWAPQRQNQNPSNSNNNKLLHAISMATHHHSQTHSHSHHRPNFSLITENVNLPSLPHPHPSPLIPHLPKNDQITPPPQNPNSPNPSNIQPPLKKRAQTQTQKSPKPKKPKKSLDPTTNPVPPRGATKSTEVTINGIDLDLSKIPTPVCSCTGTPQQCYRWGIGGWQSACCTTNISVHPLPMSEKRRGARIAGRKMSQGAFKKVLERLAGEGYNLGNPIDLRGFWAKHGTNKFVTIK